MTSTVKKAFCDPIGIFTLFFWYEEFGFTVKAETLEQIENAKAEFAKPFPYEAEMKEKTEGLNALNIELNMGEKDTLVMDAKPEQSEERPEKRSPAHVR